MSAFYIFLGIWAIIVGLSVLVSIIIYNNLGKPISLQDVTVCDCDKYYESGIIVRLEDGKVKWFEREE